MKVQDVSGFLSRDCPHDDSQLFLCLAKLGMCLVLAPCSIPSPPPASFCCPSLNPRSPAALSCVSPKDDMMLSQAQDPSQSLSPWASMKVLPWVPAWWCWGSPGWLHPRAAHVWQSSVPHSPLTSQDVRPRCNPRPRSWVSTPGLPLSTSIKQGWHGGSAAKGSKSSVYGTAINYDLLTNKLTKGLC